jgi:hypothetical protein
MPHICGPHSQLAGCRFHQAARQDQHTTWVPIPIHRVEELADTKPGNSVPNSKGTSVPVQLAAPGLIIKAKEANKDELFPRKKKSEFY